MAFTATAFGLSTLVPEEWMDRSACGTHNAELFWPVSKTTDVTYALSICGRCPVRQQCGAYAIKHQQTEGIWGGMPEQTLQRAVGSKPVRDGKKRVWGECARCFEFRVLTRRDLCPSCNTSESNRGRLAEWPFRSAEVTS